MAITDKEEGVWILDEVYNKQNQGGIWNYSSNLYGLKTCGSNSIGWAGGAGGLGLNDNVARSSPTQVGTDTNWADMHTGSGAYHVMMARKTNSTLWAWGPGGRGLLGQNNEVYRSSPTQIPGTTWDGSFFSYGNVSAMASRSDGSMWVWGSNQMGQLGLNYLNPAPAGISSPIQLPGTWSSGVSGDYAAFGTKTDGTLWAWGGHYNSNLGLNDTDNRSSPTQIGTDTDWSKTTKAAQRLVAAIKTNGTMWAWGTGARGMAGLSPTGKASSPIQIPGSWSEVATTVDEVTYGIKTDGTLWAAGSSNSAGQLGQNSTTTSTELVQIPGTWASVHPYYQSVAGVKTDGTLWVWGDGSTGRLGQNNEVSYSSPIQIPGGYNTGGKGVGGTNYSVGMLEAI
tara:strand:+ start:27 stop:1214 length:1188 start_codon:yes stop_codon:yes gene_type:complete